MQEHHTCRIDFLGNPLPHFAPSDFLFKIARTPAELKAFWRLRRDIFCREQRIFQESDRDEFDETMIPIVCTSLLMGMEDQVVGVVRIDQREPGLWWGSRLGVNRDFRHLHSMSASVSQRNRQPSAFGSIGAGLIYKAVTTAQALGCHTFLATVQSQNARFFQRLHWQRLEEIQIYGLPHMKMRADLKHYPPAEFVF